jgi:hypothetical protein
MSTFYASLPIRLHLGYGSSLWAFQRYIYISSSDIVPNMVAMPLSVGTVTLYGVTFIERPKFLSMCKLKPVLEKKITLAIVYSSQLFRIPPLAP